MSRKTATKKRNWELYWYICLTALPWLCGLFVALLPNSTPQQAAQATVWPFLVWIVATAYYLLRWTAHKLGLHHLTIDGRAYQKWKDEHQDELTTVEAHNYELWLKSKK